MKAVGADLGRLLAVMVLQGRLSLEDLDNPSEQWLALEADRRHANSRAQRDKLPIPYPIGYPWRNLARDWISAHPAEWQALLRHYLEQEESAAADHPVVEIAELAELAA